MATILLQDATIVTADRISTGSVLAVDDKISEVLYKDNVDYDYRLDKLRRTIQDIEVWNLEGKWLMAGGIDAHVHFREPGLTHKADMGTESAAAVAGGVTSVLDMPNTTPATTSAETLSEKLKMAEGKVYTNIGFNIGATNSNHLEIKDMLSDKTKVPSKHVGGVKVFMGSSTGNMLVDSDCTLEDLFKIKTRPVLVHCEDEATIKNNLEKAVERYGEEIPFTEHEHIRSRSACVKSSLKALEMAIKNGTQLVLCHISTKEELEMVRAAKLNNPDIIAETSCNYLWFSNQDYQRLGSKAKCNPSIKTLADREALREGLSNGLIDIIGSDHAPHLPEEKNNKYRQAPSGLPSIQQSLPVLLTIADENDIPLTRIASAFSEKASEIYGLKRGKIAPGYYADIVIFDKDRKFTVKAEDQLSKCGWSPYEGEVLKGYIETVLINGCPAVKDGKLTDDRHGSLLEFQTK